MVYLTAHRLRTLATIPVVLGLSISFLLTPHDGQANASPGAPSIHLVQLPGNTLGLLVRAHRLPGNPAQLPITVTITLRRTKQRQFDAFVDGVANPYASTYRRFLTQAQLTARFGPTRQAYDRVIAYMRAAGFRTLRGSANRLTVSFSGTRREAEHAFHLRIRDYRLGKTIFYANDRDPSVPSYLAPIILAVDGLSRVGRPRSEVVFRPRGVALQSRFHPHTLIPGQFSPVDIAKAYNYGGVGPFINGAGIKVGLLEANSEDYCDSDLRTYLAEEQLPSSFFYNVVRHALEPSLNTTTNCGSKEGIVDIEAVISMAPGAQIDFWADDNSTSRVALLNTMIGAGDNVISNSWKLSESQVTLAGAQAIDAVAASGAASGVSIFSITGDHRENGNDVLSSSPHVTAVGGTDITVNANDSYAKETWWYVPTCTGSACVGGGFGHSYYMPEPFYQDGFSGLAGRSLPDVSADAGTYVDLSYNGNFSPGSIGGTSLAAPMWAAGAALLDQRHGPMGNLNWALYAAATTRDFQPFHGFGAMQPSPLPGVGPPTNDFTHVGLGSPDLGRLSTTLFSIATGMTIVGESQPNATITANVAGGLSGAACDGSGTRSNSGGAFSLVLTGACGALGNALRFFVNSSPVGVLTSSNQGCALYTPGADLNGITLSAAYAVDTSCSGRTWTKQTPSTVPPARSAASLGYDPFTGTMIMFGGLGVNGALDDTWSWNGTNWTAICGTASTEPCGPQARSGASIAYDDADESMVLFGGTNATGQFLGDTWLLNAFEPTWKPVCGTSQTASCGPSIRTAAGMVRDTTHNTDVLFGGQGVSAPLDDTWLLAGTSWIAACGAGGKPACDIPALSHLAMAFDPAAGTPVVTSGRQTNGQNLSEPWIWNGDEWISPVLGADTIFSPSVYSHSYPVFAPARERSNLAYYNTSGTVLQFGGLVGNDCFTGECVESSDTWIYAGNTFTQLFPASAPSPRHDVAMAFDPILDRILLFGGLSGSTAFDDTWTWGPRVPQPACGTITFPGQAATAVFAGSSVTPGTRIYCRLAVPAGAGAITWSSTGRLLPIPTRAPDATFLALGPGPVSIVARWTDRYGLHVQPTNFSVVLWQSRRRESR